MVKICKVHLDCFNKGSGIIAMLREDGWGPLETATITRTQKQTKESQKQTKESVKPIDYEFSYEEDKIGDTDGDDYD